MSTHSVVSPSGFPTPSIPPSVVSRKVIVWTSEDGTPDELEARLREWRRNGWIVRERVPRVVEGPAHAVLIVLRRAPHRGRRARRRARPYSEAAQRRSPPREKERS